jgi:hypothetical protein
VGTSEQKGVLGLADSGKGVWEELCLSVFLYLSLSLPRGKATKARIVQLH